LDRATKKLLTYQGKAQKKIFHVTHFTVTEEEMEKFSNVLRLTFVPGAHELDGREYVIRFSTGNDRENFKNIHEVLVEEAKNDGITPSPETSLQETMMGRSGMTTQIVAPIQDYSSIAAGMAKTMAQKSLAYAKLQFDIMKLNLDKDQELLFLKLQALGWAGSVEIELQIGPIETACELSVDYTEVTVSDFPDICREFRFCINLFFGIFFFFRF